ncbi:MAG TPA: hypothetical protein VNF99_09050 [Stellaceae bacterium]|nr:hypothetical protein [Stellaceae bacterium]
MPEHDRFPRVALTQTAASRSELLIAAAAIVFLALVAGGGLVALAAQYRGGWIEAQQVQTDNAAAIHRLMFRE